MRKLSTKICIGCLIIYAYGCKIPGNTQRRNLLKEYALCKCISYYVAKEAADTNDISNAVYRELAGYGFAEYDQLDSFVKKSIDTNRILLINDYKGKNTSIMDCINFYKSKTLDSAIRLMEKKKVF